VVASRGTWQGGQFAGSGEYLMAPPEDYAPKRSHALHVAPLAFVDPVAAQLWDRSSRRLMRCGGDRGIDRATLLERDVRGECEGILT
jgi:hypothetical protein